MASALKKQDWTSFFVELVLVIIGILIALQIDTWNDERIQNNESQALIYNLKVEFEDNLVSLEREIEQLRVVQNGLVELMEVISNRSEDLTETQVDELLAKSFTSPVWDFSSYVLADLKNSGRLSNISNEKLKLLLFDWERQIGDFNVTTNNYLIYSTDYYRFITKHGSIRNVDALDPNNSISKSKLNVSNLALLDMPEFENNASNFLALSTSLMQDYKAAREKIENIITLIESK
jgi:hypothetical protein